jgi:hypothetical protein
LQAAIAQQSDDRAAAATRSDQLKLAVIGGRRGLCGDPSSLDPPFDCSTGLYSIAATNSAAGGNAGAATASATADTGAAAADTAAGSTGDDSRRLMAYRPSRSDIISGDSGGNAVQLSNTVVNSTVQRTFDLLLHVDDSHIGIYIHTPCFHQSAQLTLCIYGTSFCCAKLLPATVRHYLLPYAISQT